MSDYRIVKIRESEDFARNFEVRPDGLDVLAFGALIPEENDGEIAPG